VTAEKTHLHIYRTRFVIGQWCITASTVSPEVSRSTFRPLSSQLTYVICSVLGT